MHKSPSWHGPKATLGFHYDLHATADDTQIGLRCGPAELLPMLRRVQPDFVQTDCKGHTGYTSWFSQVPEASVPAGLKADALAQWRAASRELGVPLHCHYSGIWDAAAAKKHPEWVAVRAPQPTDAAGDQSRTRGQNVGGPKAEWLCPRSGYLRELMIPQLLEAIDRYDVDGFWIDGDLWAVDPCYCERCTAAFRERTGLDHPPAEGTDPRWSAWWNFTLESYEEFCTAYCDAVHAHKPGVLVCSNWLQTLCNPGEPRVPTDWISGDNTHVFGLDGSRVEARFLSTRGKHWDIMLWAFHFPSAMAPNGQNCFKSVEMLAQEAAVILTFGGAVQLYEYTRGIRDGRLVPWHMDRFAAVARFIREREPLCRDTETIPHIAVLHSEHHVRATVTGPNLMWAPDTAPVKGAVFALLENQFGVDVLDEWALRPRLHKFPMVVAPEQHRISDAMVSALTAYVEAGGTLLLSGAEAGARWPDGFLGLSGREDLAERVYHVCAANEGIPVASRRWQRLHPDGETTTTCGSLSASDDVADNIGAPAVTIHRVGRGRVAFAPFDLFRDFHKCRYPQLRRFVGELVRALDLPWEIEVDAPLCVDAAFRQRRDTGERLIHLVNRLSGIPNQPENGSIDQIPPVGPVKVRCRMPERPASVTLAFEPVEVSWTWADGLLTATIPQIRLHAALVITSSH